MAVDVVEVDAQDVMETITIKFTALRWLGFRLRVAGVIFRLGAWVAGTGIDLVEVDKN